MIRRGYTMVELLMSLVLLASVAVVIMGWTTRALALQETKLEDAESARSASILERSLRADLMNHDTGITAAAGVVHRVWLQRSTLFVLCRDRGPVEARYDFDWRSGAVKRSVRSIGADRSARSPAQETIAIGVSDLVWDLSKSESLPYGTLRVTWADASGDQRQLSVTIDKEWIP